MRKLLLRLLISIVAMILSVMCPAQYSIGKNGVNIGLHLAFGTHFNRIGISCYGYYTGEGFQINPGFRIYYNLKNIGPAKKYFEFAPSIGIIFPYGKTDSAKNLFVTSLGNQTVKRNSIGYSFNYYLNNIKTSQATGTISLQFGHFQIITENDLFAGGIRDEYRTGSILAQYRDKYFQYGINFTGWTGTRGVHVDDPLFPSRNGYMDMSHTLYGMVAAGLLSAQIQYATPYGQIVQGSIGIDADHVRDFFQNKLVHDLFFSPKKGKWRGGSHLPMMDSKGNLFLYKKGQQVRKDRLYANLFINPGLFY